MQMDDSIAKFASQAQAKVQTKPQATTQATDEVQAAADRLQHWLKDFDLHPTQYPVTITEHSHGKRKGQVTVCIPFPTTPPAEGRTVSFRCTLTPEELCELAKVPPWVFAHVMARQAAKAAYKLFPPGPRRKEPRTLHKWVASREAKRIHPNIKWFHENKQYQPAWFKDLCEAVKRSTNSNPTPIDITAWVIEQLFPG
jgi:hypothetical protein